MIPNESYCILMNLDLFFFTQDLNFIDSYCILINYFEYLIVLNGIHEMKRERELVAFYPLYIIVPNIFYSKLFSVFYYSKVILNNPEEKLYLLKMNDSY